MSLAVHILTWLSYDRRGSDNAAATSQRIATSINTNPVVIRRCLGQLKDGELVTVTHGRNGGWSLARAATDITLLDIYQLLPDEPVLGMPASTPAAECDVGAGIQTALSDVYQKATDALCRPLRDTTLADVLATRWPHTPRPFEPTDRVAEFLSQGCRAHRAPGSTAQTEADSREAGCGRGRRR